MVVAINITNSSNKLRAENVPKEFVNRKIMF